MRSLVSLEGKTVTLVCVGEGIAEDAVEGIAEEMLQAIEPDNTKNLSFFSESVSLSREIEYLKKMERSESDILFVVRLKNDNRIIGAIGLHEYDKGNRNARLGILIFRKEDRGEGSGGEAVQLILKHAFLEMELHKIYVRVLKTNKKAANHYRNLGFVREGYLREEYYLNGNFCDMIEFSILNREWEKQKKGAKS